MPAMPGMDLLGGLTGGGGPGGLGGLDLNSLFGGAGDGDVVDGVLVDDELAGFDEDLIAPDDDAPGGPDAPGPDGPDGPKGPHAK
jgi:hypothetical protein